MDTYFVMHRWRKTLYNCYTLQI